MLAAISIGYAAIVRLLNPQALEDVGTGLLVSAPRPHLTWQQGRILLNVGHTHHSISLEADAHHLFADVWKSAGVILGAGLVWLTGWLWLDAVIALLVAVQHFAHRLSIIAPIRKRVDGRSPVFFCLELLAPICAIRKQSWIGASTAI